MEKRLKGQLDEFLKHEDEKVERLKQRLASRADRRSGERAGRGDRARA